MERRTSLLIVGAGPFGLALAAYARHLGIDHLIVGRPMEFWKKHMPAGMLLRSACDWHLDPLEQDTLKAFLATRNQVPGDVEPLSLELYLDYAAWFQSRKGIDVVPALITHLDRGEPVRFAAALDDGGTVHADSVLLALGFGGFANHPEDLVALLPPDRFSHTCESVDLGAFRDRRCLIIGGRQSAFEWAALLRENGAAAVHLCYRHETPAFAESDWSWVGPLVERTAVEPGWYRALPDDERRALDMRFWTEGRRKLEPWLAPRLAHPSVKLWPQTTLRSSRVDSNGALEVRLDDGTVVSADHVILATGYRVDMGRVSFLSPAIRAALRVEEGFPVLDTRMQSSVPGLYVTSFPATRAFGPFFAFTSAVRAAARIVGDAIRRR